MTGGTFLKQLDSVVTGDGFYRDQMIPLRDFHLESDGSTLTTTLTTNPGWDKVDTNLTSLSWAATKVVEAGVDVDVPGDYDESLDILSVWLLAKSGSTDLTTAFEAAAYIHSAPTTDLVPDNTADLTASYAWVEINLDGNGLLANDRVHVVINPEAHGTDALHVIAAKIRYRGDLVIFDLDERSSGTTA